MRLLAVLLIASSAATSFAQDSSHSHPVEHGRFHTWGNGLIIGRPVKSSMPGLLFHTMEMEINQGSFPGISPYIGHAIEVSTENPTVFERFQALDPDQTYVFQYYRRHPLNPEMEDTHYMISWIYPMSAARPAAESTVSVESHTSRGTGGYSSGTRAGRIVHIERWGWNSVVCEVTMNMGGTAGSIDFAVYTEEACAFAEDMLRHGYDASVDYSQDYVEVWDSTSYIGHVLRRLDDSGSTVSSVAVSPEVVAAVREQLLNDPEFIAEVGRRLSESRTP